MRQNQQSEINKEKAVKLAITLGWLGGHRFYTGQTVTALAYLMFCWTLIPGFLSLIDAVFLARMTDDEFTDEFCPLQIHNPLATQQLRPTFKRNSTDLTA